jgi:cation/acetate symporter
VVIVGAVVILIVTTAGMVSTTWVQFIKGTLLVVLCSVMTVMILVRGHWLGGSKDNASRGLEIYDKAFAVRAPDEFNRWLAYQTSGSLDGPKPEVLADSKAWNGKPYLRIAVSDSDPIVIRTDHKEFYFRCQSLKSVNGVKLVNGKPQVLGKNDFDPVGQLWSIGEIPSDARATGPIDPAKYLASLQGSEIVTWSKETFPDDDGIPITIFYPQIKKGSDLLVPGGSPTFAGIRGDKLTDKLDFISLMLALFAGTASLPHILIRYYTVKDAHAARLSTVVGILTIGFFYILTLYLGLAAMTSLVLDPTDSNMAAPLLARSFGEFMFAAISAVAFTTVLGTVSGLILAASGAVAHDLLSHGLGWNLNDIEKIRVAKISAVVVGVIGIGLGIVFKDFNVTFLVGWAFNIAASANLPALVMLLFWPRTTKQGVIASVLVGMLSSLTWVLLSGPAFVNLYGIKADRALVPFSQPGLVTIPLGFLTLVVVSLMTTRRETEVGVA